MQRDFPSDQRFEGPLPGIPGTMVREVETLPKHLEGGESIAPCTEAAARALLFEVPGIARYLVRDGKSVEVTVASGADRAAARLFLLGSARGALIHQRGELPLNGTTLVAPNWKGVAICCPSALGKSTVAAALCRRGWLLVADDITRVSWNGTMAVAWPSNDRIKLWRDACEMVGANPDRLEPVRDGMEKYFVPVGASTTPTALHVVLRLALGATAEFEEVPAAERPQLLGASMFRPRWVEALGRRAEHAKTIVHIARACRGVLLQGARDCGIEELADRVVEIVR
ncbi:MAG TPA: hypothetical protein VKR31_17900 [Rhizomicrobium sp.]|nr:hypothetical protein [Rhizomicrobium sp.]